jgi:hypothetical protein
VPAAAELLVLASEVGRRGAFRSGGGELRRWTGDSSHGGPASRIRGGSSWWRRQSWLRCCLPPWSTAVVAWLLPEVSPDGLTGSRRRPSPDLEVERAGTAGKHGTAACGAGLHGVGLGLDLGPSGPNLGWRALLPSGFQGHPARLGAHPLATELVGVPDQGSWPRSSVRLTVPFIRVLWV